MKKIKLSFSKKPLTSTPKLGLLLLAEQRHRMTALMLDWYQELRAELSEELTLSLTVASLPDPKLEAEVTLKGARWVQTTPGAPLGERHNEALKATQSEGVDGVIMLSPGDLLSAALLRAYGEHLKQGGLFAGLLDLNLFDPNEFKFMHWARHQFTQGVDRVAPVGYMIARPFLDALKWKLWPNQAPSSGGFHKRVMERVEQLFAKAPKGTCVSQTMQHMGGVAISLKSELARALFEEGNWQHYPGLQFADFESAVEEHMSEAWVERLGDFDERLRLDILVEDNPDNRELWRTHYDFCIYKFLPYADVRLHLVSGSGVEAPEGWQHHVVEGSSAARNNGALKAIKEGDSDLVLFAGKGGLVDLKTIEHYLIYIFRHGARLLTVQNFYLSDPAEKTLAFWPGLPEATIPQMFGFATCAHRSYLERLEWAPFGEVGLHEQALKSLEALISEPSSRHQRVIFKCAAHELGLISFNSEETLGFEGQVRLSDLQTVSFGRLPFPAFNQEMKDLLSAWSLGVNLTSPVSASAPTTPHHVSPQENVMSEMSPLERAKALLAQSKGSAPAPAPSAPSPAPAPAPASSAGEMSPLERAKALLAQSKGSAPAPAPSAPSPSPAPAPASSAGEMSPLERAKALLAQSKGSAPAPAPSAPSPAPAPAPASSAGEMSPLERAKALLAQSKSEAPAQASAPVSASEQAQTQDMIQDAIQSAEAVVAQLTAQRDAALQATRAEAERSAVNPAAELLCEQGELAFSEGALDKAQTLFESALLIDAGSTRALSNLAVVAANNQEPWRALSCLLIALMRDPQGEGLTENLQGVLEAYPELKVAQALFV